MEDEISIPDHEGSDIRNDNKMVNLLDQTIQLKELYGFYIDPSLSNFKKEFTREITAKITGYRTQDIKKERNDDTKLITFEETTEKLVESKLQCYYCKQNVCIFYDDVRQQNQWTLDRLDNSIGHFKDNVVISCLKCNLKRRCTDSDRFKYSKKFNHIVKKL